MKKTTVALSLASSMIFGLSACVNFPYQAPIQQGNVIEANRANLIKIGMSKSQIAGTVGTPIIQDVFHKDRWDYIYRLEQHYQTPEQERMTIWFANDIAIKVERVKSAP